MPAEIKQIHHTSIASPAGRTAAGTHLLGWFRHKPKDSIPNPRDKRRRLDEDEVVPRIILSGVQVLCFALALSILAMAAYA